MFDLLYMQAMLVWWRQLVLERQRRQELLESSCYHMDAYTVHRYVAVHNTLFLPGASHVGPSAERRA